MILEHRLEGAANAWGVVGVGCDFQFCLIGCWTSCLLHFTLQTVQNPKTLTRQKNTQTLTSMFPSVNGVGWQNTRCRCQCLTASDQKEPWWDRWSPASCQEALESSFGHDGPRGSDKKELWELKNLIRAGIFLLLILRCKRLKRKCRSVKGKVWINSMLITQSFIGHEKLKVSLSPKVPVFLTLSLLSHSIRGVLNNNLCWMFSEIANFLPWQTYFWDPQHCNVRWDPDRWRPFFPREEVLLSQTSGENSQLNKGFSMIGDCICSIKGEKHCKQCFSRLITLPECTKGVGSGKILVHTVAFLMVLFYNSVVTFRLKKTLQKIPQFMGNVFGEHTQCQG